MLGIGGTTVAEAKESLTYNELMQWQAYRQEYGALNVGHRVDYAIARLIYVTRLCAGDKDAKFEDFLPRYGNTPDGDDEPELTPEMFNAMLGV